MPQYIIEYLAYTGRKQIMRVSKNFLQNLFFDMDLVEEYDLNHLYVPNNSTYPVAAEVILSKNDTSIGHFRLIGDSAIGLKSLTKVIGEIWEDFFDELFIVRDDVSRQRNTSVYDPIHQIENDLRHLILRKWRSTDQHWAENLPISPSEIARAKKNMAADKQKYQIEIAGCHILQYLTLSHLLKILKHRPDLFSSLTSEDLKSLEQLRTLRNNMAHNRHISDDDFRSIARIYSALKAKIRNELSPFHNPP